MASIETHLKKYGLFKKDASNEKNSIPTRIEAYFNASFHLIEACSGKKGIHVNKHSTIRSKLEESPDIFEDSTEDVWRAFQELENQIRPGQIYGGQINGKKLKRAQELFDRIEKICKKLL